MVFSVTLLNVALLYDMVKLHYNRAKMNPKNIAVESLSSLLLGLYLHINPRRRYQFCLLLFLTLICSCTEVVSLGVLVPFLGVLTPLARGFSYLCSMGTTELSGAKNSADLVLPLTLSFVFAVVIEGVLRFILSRVTIKLTNLIGGDLSLEVYRRTFYQPYSVHVKRNSSEIISSITQKVAPATGMLLALMNDITFFVIVTTLVLIDPFSSLVAMIILGRCYGIIGWTTRKRLKTNSRSISIELTNQVRVLQERLGAIRKVLLDGTQDVYCKVYNRANENLQKSSGENNYIIQAPRFITEALGMVFIAVFAYSLSFRKGGISSDLPVLVALSAQRLLLLLQTLYGNWLAWAGGEASLNDVLVLLNQSLARYFSETIPRLKNVFFKYTETVFWILEDVSLEVEKGSRFDFVDSIGSGKSAFIDILMKAKGKNEQLY